MKLVSILMDGAIHIGAVAGDQVIRLNDYLPAHAQVPGDMVRFLAAGEPAMQAARRALERHAREPARAVPLAEADLQAPVPRPGKIMMGGRNYLRHLDELREEGKSRQEKIVTPPMPHIFSKFAESVTGPGKPIVYPKIVKQLDLEGELTAVIGKRAHWVSEEDALDYVAGYTIINDVSARDLQAQGLLLISKGFETFCPMGPWIVTRDEIPDPQKLSVRTYINDREVCVAHTSEMLFTVRQFIASLSRVFPLEPGDVLSTGSPPGPGMYHNPPLLANPGDTMRVEIEGIGVLSNPVVAATR
ncbi:fumarylacetoacetate hydrolase family protein [Ramlibacter sp. AW1]|uniref:Fumarylacetoacetate hydrolase family protein n=1 Tax=Ramlibacter aurantiacus TaxID=2801330 RepID=A0A936ZSJ2_9BURK|nr:fumarylacetoacetate hydrolase family protein [Ramlibacter aurantiacus]MBL0422673.1 fumarylacetoacetate hydrolase family protein [Ramlibacter aurantiacus]